MNKDRKEKARSLLIKEKKQTVGILKEAISVYRGWQVRVVGKTEMNRQTIDHLIGNKVCFKETPQMINRYNELINAFKESLKEYQEEAEERAEPTKTL